MGLTISRLSILATSDMTGGMNKLKRTPLFDAHQTLGARLVEFGGWEMPVHYTSILDEHQAVRTSAGLFDISHMGEVTVTGPSSLRFLNRILTNDLEKLTPGQGHYTLMCNERGGVIDDLYAYRTASEDFLLIINASRITEDMDWINSQFSEFSPNDGTRVIDASDITGALALQGPKVADFIDQIFTEPSKTGNSAKKPTDLQKNQIAAFPWENEIVWVARTGYSGEDGFELAAPSGIITEIWNAIMDAGKPSGLKPAGLGARDTLRTEMGYPLYGHELSETTTPIEAGLGWVVGFNKPEFIGREALELQKSQGIKKKCVAFKMEGKSAPPRPHYSIWNDGSETAVIGEVVSGTQSPSLGVGIGLGYVPPDYSELGTRLHIEIRGKRCPAIVSRKPLYKKPV